MKATASQALGAVPRFLRSVLPLIGAVSLPMYFVYSDFISAKLADLLRLEPEPSLAGGRPLASFPDPLGDAQGSGSLEPPLGLGAAPGELDLVGYSVREPISRPVWSGSHPFWQLELRFAQAVPLGFADAGFRAPATHVYIDIDGAESGSVDSAFGEGELVAFDPGHPWDYVVSANGHAPEAEIRSADGAYRAGVEQLWDSESSTLILRVRLDRAPPLLASILSGRSTAHYVLVGAYDSARDGGFAPVREYAGLHSGGGALGELVPWVYDLLPPRGTSQKLSLDSFDVAGGTLARLSPVIVGQAGQAVQGSAGESYEAARSRLLAEIEAAEEERRREKAERTAKLERQTLGQDIAALAELFDLGLEDRTMAAAEAALKESPDDALALAYRGAIVALRADRATGLAQKMKLVEKAYEDLDRAVAAVAGGTSGLAASDAVGVVLCRASVSSAVPDSVFGRALEGARDFDLAFELASGDAALEERCLAGAARAFELAGRPQDAQTRWATLSERGAMLPETELALLEMGF